MSEQPQELWYSLQATSN